MRSGTCLSSNVHAVQLLCSETGKPLRQARAEVRLAAARVRQACGLLQQLPFTLAVGDRVTTGLGTCYVETCTPPNVIAVDKVDTSSAGCGTHMYTMQPAGPGEGLASSFASKPQRQRTEFVEWEPAGVVASITAWCVRTKVEMQ